MAHDTYDIVYHEENRMGQGRKPAALLYGGNHAEETQETLPVSRLPEPNR